MRSKKFNSPSIKLFSRKDWMTSPLVLTSMIIAGLVPLVVTYFYLVSSSYWNNWIIQIPEGLARILLLEAFGLYAVGAYCLIVLAVVAFSFKPYKFDPVLYGIRFSARIIQLLFVIDFIILVLSPSIWGSFLLILPVALSYFIIEGSKFRLRFRSKGESAATEISRDEEQITIPYDGAFEILVAGTGIDKFSVNIEQAGGSVETKFLNKLSSENQWEISNLSIDYERDLPCSILILHNKDQMRRFSLKGEIPEWLDLIRLEIIADGDVVLKDGEIKMLISDSRPVLKLVEKAYDKYTDAFPNREFHKANVYRFNDDKTLSPKLNLQKSIRRNQIKNNQKIRIEL